MIRFRQTKNNARRGGAHDGARSTWTIGWRLSSLVGAIACQATPAAVPAATPPPVAIVAVPAAPSAAPAALPRAPLVEFSVAVEGDCSGLDIGTMEDGPAVWRVLPAPPSPGGTARQFIVFARLGVDEAFHDDARLGRGLTLATSAPFDWVYGLSGQWDRTAHIILSRREGRIESADYPFEWKDERWRPLPRVGPGFPYRNGSRLLMGSPAAVPTFRVEPKQRWATPNFSALAHVRSSHCAFSASAILPRPTGEVFVAGAFCDAEISVGIARWQPDAGATRMVLPAGWNYIEVQRFVDAGPQGLFAFAGATPSGVEGNTTPASQLLRFDGVEWTRVTTPFESGATDEHTEPDGTLWVTVDGRLYRRDPDATWRREIAVYGSAVGYVQGRPVWAATNRGRLVAQRMPGGTWRSVGIPKASFAADRQLTVNAIRVDAEGEPWLLATYPKTPAPAGTDELFSESDRVVLLRHTGISAKPGVWCSAERDVPLGTRPVPSDTALPP